MATSERQAPTIGRAPNKVRGGTIQGHRPAAKTCAAARGGGAAPITIASVRDRRWDFLYEREKEPVRDWVLARFAERLGDELAAWPPAELAWTSDAERARWSIGAAAHPRDDVIRLALERARLDLAREFDALEAHLAREAHRLQSPAEEAAVHLLARLVAEACLELAERADRLRLGRKDLIAAVDQVERRLFRVTLR